MAKKRMQTKKTNDKIYAIHSIVTFTLWVSAILVCLSVGFSMTRGGALYNSIPFVPAQLTAMAGWIIITLISLSTILAIIEALSGE